MYFGFSVTQYSGNVLAHQSGSHGFCRCLSVGNKIKSVDQNDKLQSWICHVQVSVVPKLEF